MLKIYHIMGLICNLFYALINNTHPFRDTMTPILTAIFSGSGRKAISRQMSVNKFLNSLHEQINFSNQWYLSSIGVNPEHQKKGHGSILLRSMLSRFEKDKLSCFLDTQKKENIPLYEHFGFKIVKEAIIPGTDVRTYLMSTSR